MRILLVAPASGHWRGLGKRGLFNGKTFRFSMLSLLSVAALTPEPHEVTLIDEQIDDIPWKEPFDLVGITVMTATAPRAYQLCREFRRRSVAVVVGGFHPTFNADEAAQHADAVVVGPAGGAWPAVLADVAAGCLKTIYRGDPSVAIPATLPRRLLNRAGYVSIQTCCATQGCANDCAFCSITAFYGGRRFCRDVGDIVHHLESFHDRFFLFVDDNLTQDRDYAIGLCKAIAPLRKKWATQASVEVADDPELLAWMARAGCVGVFVGLESFSDAALCSQNKRIRSAQHYRDAVAALHRHGIVVEAGLIFGFDADGRDVFDSTLRFMDAIGIDAMQASILTPLPGTRLFEQMRPRIVDFNWEHYDYKWAVFEPAQMTREDLMAGLQWINKRFYSPWRIARRLARWLTMPRGLGNFHIPLWLNVAYWGRQFRFDVKGYNPRLRASARQIRALRRGEPIHVPALRASRYRSPQAPRPEAPGPRPQAPDLALTRTSVPAPTASSSRE